MREVYFDGDGCCISQAAASMLVEKFDGKPIDEVKQFTAQDMLELFGVRLTPNRQKCCLLAVAGLAGGHLFAASATARPHAGDGGEAKRHERRARRPTPLDAEALRRDFPILGRDGARAACRWSTSTTPPPRSGRGR